jgi:putative heme-binding domain-containing protein
VCLFLASTHSASEDAPDVDSVVTLLDLVIDADEDTARRCLAILTRSLQSGELPAKRVEGLRERLGTRLAAIVRDGEHPLRLDAAVVAAAWKDADGLRVAREAFAAGMLPAERRLVALASLVAADDETVLESVRRALAERTGDGAAAADFRGQVLAALGRLERAEVAGVVLAEFDRLEPDVQPRAIELLTQRPVWSRALLAAVAEKRISKDALNLNQLRRLASFKDEELQAQFKALYGALREGRSPERERVVRQMRDFLRGSPGDPHSGEAAFKKVCAQCHKIYGAGEEVGPDVTLNGRNNWEQLLSNVFDPSLVIGPGYQARQLLTDDGRVLTGLAVEEGEQRVVLKVQGGKLETIPRDQIEEYKVSDVSMMPEQLENQLTRQEIADLMAFLALDRHPRDPEAKYLPGAPVRSAK